MRQLSAHKMPYITFNFNANLWMNINNDVDDTMRLAFQLNKKSNNMKREFTTLHRSDDFTLQMNIFRFG